MKLYFLLIWILILSIIVACVKKNPDSVLTKYSTDRNIERVVIRSDSGKTFTILFHPNGTIRKQYTEKFGELQGVFNTFYENGILEQQIYKKNGLNQGKAFTYYPSGEIRDIASFRDGLQNGDSYYYLPNGKIRSLNSYYKNHLYFKRVWTYDTLGNEIRVFTGIYPVIAPDTDVNTIRSDTLKVTFNLPLDNEEFMNQYLRMNVILSCIYKGRVIRQYELKDVQFENDQFIFPVRLDLADSIQVKGIINYSEPPATISFDTFYQTIHMHYVEETEEAVNE
ncbi:MAG TPA: hypothetical protein VI603_00800 [Saprospiraceae bacterium]|nr:hypothetical protein [Saprospiraceae bacterium]